MWLAVKYKIRLGLLFDGAYKEHASVAVWACFLVDSDPEFCNCPGPAGVLGGTLGARRWRMFHPCFNYTPGVKVLVVEILGNPSGGAGKAGIRVYCDLSGWRLRGFFVRRANPGGVQRRFCF
jgi:hypothetical protein